MGSLFQMALNQNSLTIRNSVTNPINIDDFRASHAVTFEFTRRFERGRRVRKQSNSRTET